MKNSHKLIQLDSRDNVLVARQAIAKGEIIAISNSSYEIKQTINLGFKLALKRIESGEKIIKYGTPIGSATTLILPGEMIHVHNMKSDYVPTYTIKNQDDYQG